ncbi:MAG: adenylosuccinate lyase [Chloroflexi bacterium]|nr:adenylosuccinate lyase [Chloroflexota bacterium]
MSPTASYTHDTYLSPFTWRYGSDAMRRLWSEGAKRRLWRRIWVALASAQAEAGLVGPEQVADLRAHQDDVDWERAQELERDLRHDLMAEVRTYAEQCPVGGGIIHLGATSMDVEDNADALRLREALALVRTRLAEVLAAFAARIEAEADTVIMAYTHLQPAEPTTLGYRLSQYAQDFLMDLEALDQATAGVRGKGFKGAVGTQASYEDLLAGTGMSPEELEARVMAALDLRAFPVATQTYPRKMDYTILNVLGGLAQSAYKFALDLRLLQSPLFGEMAEPFGRQQVGSSAMPFKRNPIASESICSLARYVAGLPRVAWDNAAHSALERTLDDSANRREALPEAFLAVDEMLGRVQRIVAGLRIGREAIARNLQAYGPFAATEPLLMALARAGADRQEMHERIRDHSMEAWAAVQRGEPNPLADLLAADPQVARYLSAEEVRALFARGAHAGGAAQRSRALVAAIRETLAAPPRPTAD